MFSDYAEICSEVMEVSTGVAGQILQIVTTYMETRQNIFGK